MNVHDVAVPVHCPLAFEQEHLVAVDRLCPYQHDGLAHV